MRFTAFISTLLSCVAIAIPVEAIAAQSVNLAWNPSPDTNVVGYVVYYGTASRRYTNVLFVGKTSSATVSGIPENVTCYFAVTARDARGLESDFSNEVSWLVPTVLEPTVAQVTVRTNGNGRVSPDLSTRALSIGKYYAIVAIPDSGYVFAGWSGSTNSTEARLPFLMAPGLVFEARFIPSPFIPVAGSYTGLFYEDDAVRQGRSGLFTVSVTKYGSYSGRLQVGAERRPFSGRLDVDCQASSLVTRGGSNVLTLQFHLGSGAEADMVSGSVSDGSWTAGLQGNRAAFNILTNPAPYAGTYNLILPGKTGNGSLPAGDGYGSLRINTAGRITFSGMLADGSRMGQSVSISKNGYWPFYVSLSGGKGSLLSWLAFEDRPNDDINGLLSWIKPGDGAALYYPRGFTNLLNAVGSHYTAPVADADSAVSFSAGRLRFWGGELSSGFTNWFTLGERDKVTNLSSNRLTMTFSRSSGRFSGRVTEPATGLSRVFRGAVLQKANVGCGYMMATNQSSRVVAAP